ncbi:MAG: hypothetical protein WBN57_09360 [Gammaproteobacteria bacterium]
MSAIYIHAITLLNDCGMQERLAGAMPLRESRSRLQGAPAINME